VGFRVDHLVISKVNGEFKDYKATLHVDGKTLTAATAEIKVASVDTGIKDRDKHLLGADFFDAEKHPTITFTCKSTKKKAGKDVLVGDLTLHGVTKEIELAYELKGPIKDPWGNTKVGFAASGTISRKAFGLTWSKKLETGGLVVGDEVELLIDVEAAKK